MSAERHLNGSKLLCLTGKHMHKRNQDNLIHLHLLTYCIFWNWQHVLLSVSITKNRFILLILQDDRSCKLHWKIEKKVSILSQDSPIQLVPNPIGPTIRDNLTKLTGVQCSYSKLLFLYQTFLVQTATRRMARRAVATAGAIVVEELQAPPTQAPLPFLGQPKKSTKTFLRSFLVAKSPEVSVLAFQ